MPQAASRAWCACAWACTQGRDARRGAGTSRLRRQLLNELGLRPGAGPGPGKRADAELRCALGLRGHAPSLPFLKRGARAARVLQRTTPRCARWGCALAAAVLGGGDLPVAPGQRSNTCDSSSSRDADFKPPPNNLALPEQVRVWGGHAPGGGQICTRGSELKPQHGVRKGSSSLPAGLALKRLPTFSCLR